MHDNNKKLNQYLKRSAMVVAVFMVFSFTTSGHASVITTGCFEAASCTLKELFAGGSITVNDMVFENWGTGFSRYFSPDYSQIVVTGLGDGGNHPGPGLRYDLNGQVSWMNHEFTDEIYPYLSFNFQVAITNRSATINGSLLTLIDFQIFGPDYWCDIEIIESISGGIHHINPLNVPNLNDDFEEFLFDSTSFDPQSKVRIETTQAMVIAGLGGGSIDSFEQRFSQTVIPVPPAFWLFGSGLLGLVVVARRRKDA